MTKKIKFTDRARVQIEKIIAKDQIKKFFRISVKGGGCSGFKYDFSFDDKINKNDVLFDKTVIDSESLDIISGWIIDFKKDEDAYYYLRVISAPTCRWSHELCIQNPNFCEDHSQFPKSIQERAWTSPIWIDQN